MSTQELRFRVTRAPVEVTDSTFRSSFGPAGMCGMRVEAAADVVNKTSGM